MNYSRRVSLNPEANYRLFRWSRVPWLFQFVKSVPKVYLGTSLDQGQTKCDMRRMLFGSASTLTPHFQGAEARRIYFPPTPQAV